MLSQFLTTNSSQPQVGLAPDGGGDGAIRSKSTYAVVRALVARQALRTLGAAALSLCLALACAVIWAGSAERPEEWDPPVGPTALSTAPGDFRLNATPSIGLIDEPVHVTVVGVRPGEAVVVRASTVDGMGMRFDAWARFEADEDGTVDLRTMRPREGTYRSVDPGGLLWSMRSEGRETYQFPSDSAETQYRISAETRSGVAETMLTRINPANQIPMESIHTETLDAQFWAPTSGGRLPAIVRLHGSDGEFAPIQCALLASSGIAVLDLRYMRGRIPEIVEIPIERIMQGIHWLTNDSRVDGGRIGVLGASKGAELALLVAAQDPRVRVVAAWSPAAVAFEGISLRSLAPGSSWSWRGRPVPYAPYVGSLSGTLRHTIRLLFRNVSFLPVYENALAHAPEAAAIPVERSNAAMLLLAGTDDRMWPAARMTEMLALRLEAHGHRRIETRTFGAAGHRMRYALWPDLHAPSRIVGGGTPEGNHAAGQLAWRKTKHFFAREL